MLNDMTKSCSEVLENNRTEVFMKTTKIFFFLPSLALIACSGGVGVDSQKAAVAPETVSEQTVVVPDESVFYLTQTTDLTQTPLYTKPMTKAYITRIFGIAKNTPVTQAVFERFLKNKVKLAPTDATQAALSFLNVNSNAFIPDVQKKTDLNNAGLTDAKIKDGLLPSEYLTYLRIAHGDGPCANAMAGSQACPAYVRDFQMSVITNQNGIFNVRTTGANQNAKNTKYINTLTIHRESQANRLLFNYIGNALGLGGNPLKQVVLDPAVPASCSELESMLGSSAALERFLTNTAKVNSDVAHVTARQWGAQVTEITNNVKYVYGFAPFLKGGVCSRDKLGECYEADPQMTARLDIVVPGFLEKASFNCREIAAAVNILTSMPIVEPIDFSKPLVLPYDGSSPKLTADELFDFFIALGNGLTNRSGALFADTLPKVDLDMLNNSVIENPENLMTSQTHKYFLQRFVGK